MAGYNACEAASTLRKPDPNIRIAVTGAGIICSIGRNKAEVWKAIEESRADLVALYFLPDRKLVEFGLVPEDAHEEIVRTEYESYARNALVQLRRVREGTDIEEDHMRNRQMIVHWLMAHTTAIERPCNGVGPP